MTTRSDSLFTTAPMTTGLLLIIIAVFTAQALTGVDVDAPSFSALVTWGANFFPLSFGSEPWRLISSAFLHIGFIHLLFNGFALYFFGRTVELVFGSVKFLALFVLSAIGGNLLNGLVTWQAVSQQDLSAIGVSAGASGGIMGLGMALLTIEAGVMLRRKRLIRQHALSADALPNNSNQLKSLALIMGINLIYGFVVPGIDNAGHIGGAISGAILAVGFLLDLLRRPAAKSGQPKKFVVTWTFIVLMSVLYLSSWYHIFNHWTAFAAAYLS